MKLIIQSIVYLAIAFMAFTGIGYSQDFELSASIASASVTTQAITDIVTTTATGNGTIVASSVGGTAEEI